MNYCKIFPKSHCVGYDFTSTSLISKSYVYEIRIICISFDLNCYIIIYILNQSPPGMTMIIRLVRYKASGNMCMIEVAISKSILLYNISCCATEKRDKDVLIAFRSSKNVAVRVENYQKH